MSDADLELRVERLETALAELRAIVMLQPSPPRTGEKVPQADEGAVAVASGTAPHPPAAPSPRTRGEGVLELSGISVLIFGGAYLLRALTESAVIPQIAGVALGLAYALIWIVTSDRTAKRGRRRNAAFYAGTAAAIAFPLVWETTVRFQYVSPAAGGSCAALIGVILLLVAWHNDEQVIAWIGSIGSIAITIAIVRPDAILPLMICGSVVGAVTLQVTKVMRWKFVPLPVAVLTNALAAMTVGLPLLRGTIENPGAIIVALLAFAAVWLGIIFRMEHLGFFDIIETALLLMIGVGGAALIAGASHQYAIPLAALYGVAAVAAFIRNWPWLALYLSTLAALLTFDLRFAALIVAFCAFIGMIRAGQSQVVLLTISILLLFLIAGEDKGPLIRTCILAAVAAALALGSQLTVARIVLVFGGLKLLIEDIRLESAAVLVISFASYGLAMLTVARCVRRHTSDVHQSPITPVNDTFSRNPGDQTV